MRKPEFIARIGSATVAFWVGLSCTAFAQATCDTSGPGPNPVDPTLAPRIIAWVTKVENNLSLMATNWHGMPPHAATAAEAAALELQALVAQWEAAAQPGTVEAIFRSAVAHGVNVQYEALMVTADRPNAKTHQFWADTEASRAAACLALIQMPLAPIAAPAAAGPCDADVNDPACVHIRAAEVKKHPERAMELECSGLKAYEDPQPPGHPMPLAECDRITRDDQRRLGLPVTGLSDQQKAIYRGTWGTD